MVTEIYLRYAVTNQDIAAAVREALEKVGFVVRDGRGTSSESFRGLVREAVNAGGSLLLLWSEAMSDPDWVDADMKLIVAAWSRDHLLMARIDGAALPLGLRDQPCHELRSDQLDRDIGSLTLSILAQHRQKQQEAETRQISPQETQDLGSTRVLRPPPHDTMAARHSDYDPHAATNRPSRRIPALALAAAGLLFVSGAGYLALDFFGDDRQQRAPVGSTIIIAPEPQTAMIKPAPSPLLTAPYEAV